MKINGYNYDISMVGTGKPTWLFLHGFLGSKNDFAKIVPRGTCVYVTTYGFTATDKQVPATGFEYQNQITDLVKILDNLKIDQVNLVGYSMGARLALSFAIDNPTRIKHLFLESGTAGIADVDARIARQQADELKAKQIEANGLIPFVNHWETIPLFNSQQNVSKSAKVFMHQQRIQHNPTNMANSLRYFGTGMMPNWWKSLATMAVPTTLITGELDKKFTNLNNQMTELLPHVHHISIPNTGHNVHFEKPDKFTSILNKENNDEN
ncbi:2-succinyl-6-hydroxy-2,4-cyclohexadiene-1-carboxylate synthase [Fructilactobacillus sp. Tb1]|uniref:2-succinyl-6-hydroxy-2, 4-cyclohexadiene-1-carboxylate synthase n=1 Tax=Fructilactobacillus sp. Tb1 TaxID=3422304 RepID=UPI003D2998A8